MERHLLIYELASIYRDEKIINFLTDVHPDSQVKILLLQF